MVIRKRKERKYYIFYAKRRWVRIKKPIKGFKFAKKVVISLNKKGIKAYIKKSKPKNNYFR